jgi:hypothetical protein
MVPRAHRSVWQSCARGAAAMRKRSLQPTRVTPDPRPRQKQQNRCSGVPIIQTRLRKVPLLAPYRGVSGQPPGRDRWHYRRRPGRRVRAGDHGGAQLLDRDRRRPFACWRRPRGWWDIEGQNRLAQKSARARRAPAPRANLPAGIGHRHRVQPWRLRGQQDHQDACAFENTVCTVSTVRDPRRRALNDRPRERMTFARTAAGPI